MKTAITRLEWKFVKRITPFIGVMLIMQFQHVIYIDLSFLDDFFSLSIVEIRGENVPQSGK